MRLSFLLNRFLLLCLLSLMPMFSMAQASYQKNDSSMIQANYLRNDSSIAQPCYPENDGERVRYNIQIELRQAYLSGICILVRQGNTVASSIVNEFGVSLMDFTYDSTKQKVKIHNIVGKMNRWYIKRILKKDIKAMLDVMRSCGNEYINGKYNIKYTFSINNGFTE